MSKWIPFLVVVAVAGGVFWYYRKHAKLAMAGTANTTGAPEGATSGGALAALTAGSTQAPALPLPNPLNLTTVVSRAAQAAAGDITIHVASDSAADQALAQSTAQIRQNLAIKVLNNPEKAARLAREIGKKCHVSGRPGVRALNSTGTDTWCDTKSQLPPVTNAGSGNYVNQANPTGAA